MTVQLSSDAVHVPVWVHDLVSFRHWMHSDEAPEKCPIFFLAGEVWLDLSKEQFFSHNQMKKAIFGVLAGLEKQARGRFIPDGMLVTNEAAGLSGNPDGVFVSHDSFRTGRVKLIEGKKEDGYVELEGTPDMVLEVVSDSSVEKDNELLMDLYRKAGIREYWLVDAQGERIEFQILHHTTRGYSSLRRLAEVRCLRQSLPPHSPTRRLETSRLHARSAITFADAAFRAGKKAKMTSVLARTSRPDFSINCIRSSSTRSR